MAEDETDPRSLSAAETVSPVLHDTPGPSDPETWRSHLTPGLRKKFEKMGEEIVRFDVTNHRYGSSDKHFAALCWLQDERKKRNRRNILLLMLAVIGTLAAILPFL